MNFDIHDGLFIFFTRSRKYNGGHPTRKYFSQEKLTYFRMNKGGEQSPDSWTGFAIKRPPN